MTGLFRATAVSTQFPIILRRLMRAYSVRIELQKRVRSGLRLVPMANDSRSRSLFEFTMYTKCVQLPPKTDEYRRRTKSDRCATTNENRSATAHVFSRGTQYNIKCSLKLTLFYLLCYTGLNVPSFIEIIVKCKRI